MVESGGNEKNQFTVPFFAFMLLFNQMVKYEISNLNLIFAALSDPTRRDILERLKLTSFNVGELARNYNISLAAVSKHVSILQRAGLIKKRIEGTAHYLELEISQIKKIDNYLEQFESAWAARVQNLNKNLSETEWK